MPSLFRHPDTPPGAIQSIEAELERFTNGAVAIFRVRGDISKLLIPPPGASVRADELWKTTCFELFVADERVGYREYNFSPSGQWAAYEFDDYRSGRRDVPVEVETEVCRTNNELHLNAKVRTEFKNPSFVGLTAVIEQTDGATQFWATSFAPGKPDFHAPAVRSLLFDGVSAE